MIKPSFHRWGCSGLVGMKKASQITYFVIVIYGCINTQALDMFYMPTHYTHSGHVAGLSSIPLFYMMLTTLNLNQKGNVEQLVNFKKFKFNSISGLAGFFGSFSLWFCRGSRLVWYLENANIKTAGENKVLKNRKNQLNNAFQCASSQSFSFIILNFSLGHFHTHMTFIAQEIDALQFFFLL